MATIKSYTDIKQSKRLIAFLPLESADMILPFAHKENNEYVPGHAVSRNYIEAYNEMLLLPAMDKDTLCKLIQPCWSLSALLSVIPQEIFYGEYTINITEGCNNKWVLTYDHHKNRNHSYYGLTVGADNLVDACVTMIEKLRERNLLCL